MKTLRSTWGLLGAAMLLAACGKGEQPAKGGRRAGGTGEPRAVRTVAAEERALGQAVTVTGSLDAYEQATVGARVAGRVQSLGADLGSVVTKGQVLARIEPIEFQLKVQQSQAALEQARARIGLPPDGGTDQVDPLQTGTVRQAKAVLDEARVNRQRAQSLVEEGLMSRAQFDAVEATYQVAESRYQDAIEEIHSRRATASQRRAELALSRKQLQDTAVRAPSSGVVQQRHVSVGESVAAGAPLFDVVRVNPLRLRADVPEREAASVRVGQVVRLSVDGAPREYEGRIARVSPTISARNRVLTVEADIPNDGGLRAGSFARATIVTDDTSRGVTVPDDAIVTFAGIEKVLVVKDGKALEKPVTTGRRGGGWTEIVSGLGAGEAVVVKPGNLQSGQPVTLTGGGGGAAPTRGAAAAVR